MTDVVLPGSLAGLLDGNDLSGKTGHTFVLCAAEPSGWPRIALLSVGEIFAPSPSTICIVTYAGSRTTVALTSSGRAAVMAVLDGVAYKVSVQAQRKEPPGDLGDAFAWFSCAVEAVDVDAVGYAQLVGGITYELPDPAPVVARWERQVSDLRRLVQPG